MAFDPSSSELTILLVTNDSYQETMCSGNPHFLIASIAFPVLRLLKAPATNPSQDEVIGHPQFRKVQRTLSQNEDST